MATALNGLVHLIPLGQAFSTSSRLAFGGTVAEKNADTPPSRYADTPNVIPRLASLPLGCRD